MKKYKKFLTQDRSAHGEWRNFFPLPSAQTHTQSKESIRLYIRIPVAVSRTHRETATPATILNVKG